MFRDEHQRNELSSVGTPCRLFHCTYWKLNVMTKELVYFLPGSATSVVLTEKCTAAGVKRITKVNVNLQSLGLCLRTLGKNDYDLIRSFSF